MQNKSVDDLVTTWVDKVTVISRNLTELTESEAAKRIRNRMRGMAQPAYTGLTLADAQAAFKAVDMLLNDYLLLESVVTHAANLHQRSNLFRNNEDEVRELLEGASVRLPATHIPLKKRGLLDAGVQAEAATPDEMLTAMLDAFNTANQTIVKIDEAEATLDKRLSAIQDETSALKTWAQKMGLQEILTACESLENAGSNPLQASQDLDALESRFDQWRQELAAAEKTQAALRAALERSRDTLQQLEDLANRSRLAIEETNRTVAGHHSYIEPTSPEALKSHWTWLARLEESASSGRWQAVKVGLTSFEASVDTLMKAELQAYTQNRKSLDTIAELKGRFDALRFKAKAYGERGMTLAPAIPGIQANIASTMKQTPINVQLLERLVTAYDTALLATSRNGK